MLDSFFNPKSVALIGATDRPGSVGLGVGKNLLEGKSRRKIFFVNPNKKKVLGKKTYASVISIKGKVDLAVVAVPASIVPKVVRDCARKKVGGVIVISAGFAEIGREGERRQKEIAEILKKANIPLLGPNCLGSIRPAAKLNASFAPATPKEGAVAFVSQSGALIDSVIDKALAEDYGFSALISYGNEADLGVGDFLKFLAGDKKTKAIALYLEGLKNGREFIKIAKYVGKETPIVVLKGGRTKAGQRAARSHTASLAGTPEIYSAAFRKAGIFEVETVEDLLGVSSALAQAPACQNGAGIVTNGGAVGVLTADWCERFGVHLSSAPLDIIGDALAEKYRSGIAGLLGRKNIKGLIVCQTLQIMTEVKKNAQVIIEAQKKYPEKPILALFLGGKLTKVGVDILRKNSIPCFAEPRQAALAMWALIWRKKILK